MREVVSPDPRLRIVATDERDEYQLFDASKTPNLDTDDEVECDIFFQTQHPTDVVDPVDGVSPAALLAVVIDRLGPLRKKTSGVVMLLGQALQILVALPPDSPPQGE